MRNINLFVEDVAHEDFLTALIQRLADATTSRSILNPPVSAVDMEAITYC